MPVNCKVGPDCHVQYVRLFLCIIGSSSHLCFMIRRVWSWKVEAVFGIIIIFAVFTVLPCTLSCCVSMYPTQLSSHSYLFFISCVNAVKSVCYPSDLWKLTNNLFYSEFSWILYNLVDAIEFVCNTRIKR